MVQKFHVVRCYSCGSCQVHIVRKDGKFSCKVCGLKQSVRKVYGQGSARDCRLHVQKLNNFIAKKNSAEDRRTEDVFASASEPSPREHENYGGGSLEIQFSSAAQAEGNHCSLTSRSCGAEEEQFKSRSGYTSQRDTLPREIPLPERYTSQRDTLPREIHLLDGYPSQRDTLPRGIPLPEGYPSQSSYCGNAMIGACKQTSHSREVMKKTIDYSSGLNCAFDSSIRGVHDRNEMVSPQSHESLLPSVRESDTVRSSDKSLLNFTESNSQRGWENQIGRRFHDQSQPGPSRLSEFETTKVRDHGTPKAAYKTRVFQTNYEGAADVDFPGHATAEGGARNTVDFFSCTDPRPGHVRAYRSCQEQTSALFVETNPLEKSKQSAVDNGEVLGGKDECTSEDLSSSSHWKVEEARERSEVKIKSNPSRINRSSSSKSTLYSKYLKCDDLEDLNF